MELTREDRSAAGRQGSLPWQPWQPWKVYVKPRQSMQRSSGLAAHFAELPLAPVDIGLRGIARQQLPELPVTSSDHMGGSMSENGSKWLVYSGKSSRK